MGFTLRGSPNFSDHLADRMKEAAEKEQQAGAEWRRRFRDP